MQVTIRPDNVLPLRTGSGRIEYVAMSDTYTITLRGLTAEEVRGIGARLVGIDDDFVSIEESANTAREDPPLPAEFQRRLEIE